MNLNKNILDLVNKAVRDELHVSDEILIENLYNNPLLAGLSISTIDKAVHDIAEEDGKFEII